MKKSASAESVKDDGGQAFPRLPISGNAKEYLGMSLRDYFAAKAMQAMLCADADNGRHRTDSRRTTEFAYRVADAMIAERK